MSTDALPEAVTHVAGELAELPATVAVALGGSRATGTHRPDSDWDLGLYYRGSRCRLDPEQVRRLGYPGQVSELGDWGPIVHGGGWLTVDGTHVDVLFRDLDTVEHWHEQARHGHFEVMTQTGYLAGAPTYLPVGELAIGHRLFGELPEVTFPEALAETAPRAWWGQAEMALLFAQGYADLGDGACCTGMLVRAVLCSAHARMAARREWVLNEKYLVDRAELAHTRPLLTQPGTTSDELAATVTAASRALGIHPGATR
ncbi:hypothetical protein FHX42_002064 [Saccharopolyspora lacisalsi]|uniref:Polymerase nucleotidyl transferase domain-containing protein n=1 Tax=Halosaccharopolyspora lacisalsi TaxID=1000566 RepID=A0A839DZ01_9PSEU|nr:nucleotidyltransferase domain-containing protein [Halosaccharopolyspora lacisalsi]MBA8824717.1 hypothetical protein [Halosaccharopolyspora lacisalsi]